ncbi:MAG: SDR family oxidoreductase, partial [Planctomycetes bacterium]|nr:SDR family oxidoreductase [Planctomycetota bacterium]
VALITGASRGIGRAVAIGLAQDGYQTILVGRSGRTLEPVAQTICEHVVQNNALAPLVVPLDLSRLDHIDPVLGPVIYKLGRVDVLVNNAGQYISGSLDMRAKDLEHLLRVNVTAQAAVLQSVVPMMTQQGGGHIFNVASRAGKVGFPGVGGYCASKFALAGFGESLYRELVPQGIKVTTLCPGWVNTDMAAEAHCTLEPDDMIQPEDLYKTVQWLLSLSPGTCVKDVLLESPKSMA